MNRRQALTRNTSTPDSSIHGRFAKAALLVLTLVVVLAAVCGDSAEARGRRRGRSRGRSSAAAAAAKKKQMIAQIQKQVAAAQQILVMAQSKGAVSQQQVSAALSQLSALHQTIASSRVDVKEAMRTLHEVEQEILDEQADDSEYALAEKALEQSKDALNQIIHSYAKLPKDPDQSADAFRSLELAKMPPETRRLLEADSKYRQARIRMEHATTMVESIEKKLFQADADWVGATKDLAAAEKDAKENSKQASTVGLGSLGDRQDLRKAQQLAAMAQAVIQRGQAQLRALGVKSTSGSYSSQSKK